MAVADELVTILGVDIAKNAMAKLESFKNGVNSVKNTLMGLSAVIAGYAAAGAILVKGATEEAAELEKLSNSTKMSTDALQEWAFAASQAGADSKAVQGDLAKLQEKFGATGKSAEEHLLSLADRMRGLSDIQANDLGKSMGLSADTITLLKKGRVGIEELRKEAHKLGGIIPEQSIKRAAEFKRQMGELQFALHGLTTQVAIAMIPALSRATELFKGWIGKNREWISLGLAAIMNGVVAGFEGFWNILKGMGRAFDPILDAIKPFLGDMSAMEWVAHLVKGALAGLLLFFSPLIAEFLLFGAAAAVAAVFLEDLFSSIFTGEGAIADMFRAFAERWPELFAAIQKAGTWLKEKFFAVIEWGWDVIKGLGAIASKVFADLASGINRMIGPVKDFFNTFDERYPSLSKVLSSIAGFVKNVLGRAFNVVVAVVSELGTIISWALGQIGELIADYAELADMAVKKLGELADSFKKTWQEVKDWFTKLWDDISAAFPDFATWAEKAKTAIMNSLGYAVDWLKEKLADLLPDWAVNLLGLSPGKEAGGQTGDSGQTGAQGPKLANYDRSGLNFKRPSVVRAGGEPAKISVPVQAGQQTTQYNDNKTVHITIATSDPQQAGQAAAAALGSGQPVGTPGSTPSAR